MTEESIEKDSQPARRDTLHLGPVPSIDELGSFPAYKLVQGTMLYRVHTLPPVFYGNDVGARFYLPPETGYGTCYLAEHPVPGLHEAYYDRRAIPATELRTRKISRLEVIAKEPLQLADCTDGGASGFGITLEISAAEYALIHPWSKGFFDAGFRGVRFWSRHDPARTAPCVALFAPHKSDKEIQVCDTDTLEDSEVFDSFARMKRIQILGIPSV